MSFVRAAAFRDGCLNAVHLAPKAGLAVRYKERQKASRAAPRKPSKAAKFSAIE